MRKILGFVGAVVIAIAAGAGHVNGAEAGPGPGCDNLILACNTDGTYTCGRTCPADTDCHYCC